MGSAKRRRQRANRESGAEAAQAIPQLTDTDLDHLLTAVTVRVDCEHASTRTTADGPVLLRCAVGAAVAGGCPAGCQRFQRRPVGGTGIGLGAGGA
ncbi:MAG: hypothetical protein ABR511_00330 [Acidimicrobiales bacterium]